MESSKPFYAKRAVKILVLSLAILFLAGWTLCLEVSAQHGAAAPAGEEGQPAQHHGGSPWSVIFKWINFLILFGGLGWKLRKPLFDFLDSRRQEIGEGLAKAREAQEEAKSKLAEVEARLAGMDEEIRQLKAQALRQADEERLRILEGAGLEARKILDMASMEIDGIRKAARLELKGYVADLSVQLAEERLKSAIGPREHKKIVERFVEELGSVRN